MRARKAGTIHPSSFRVKLLDFGLAKPADTEIELTGRGAVVGTPAYMSPEQARGEQVDHRTDLFSLGAVLYRLCSGRLPFDGPTTMSVLTALATETPPPVQTLCPAVPESMAELIHQLLAKRPEARPSSAAEVVLRLRAIAEGPATTPTAPGSTRAKAPTRLPAPGRVARKRRILTIASLMVAAGVFVLAAAVYFWQMADGKVVRIECDDPSIKLAFDGGELKISGAYKEPIKLSPGKVALKVIREGTQGDNFEFETDKLIVHRGDRIALKIEVVEGKVQIVQAGKGVLDSKLVPTPNKAGAWETAVARMDAKDQVKAVGDRLKKLSPKFDESSLSPRIENGVVVALEVADASGLHDLTPLRALSGLKDLHLHGRFVGAADLGPLRGMKLESFQSNGCPHKDLSPLAGMPLTKANFWGIATTDLTPLRGMKLVETNVGHSSVKDISVLKGMPLEIVCLNISHVDDLNPLAGAPLKKLEAANIRAKDLRPVANAPIEWLTINGTPIEDLTPLLTMPIKALEMDNPQQHAKLLRKIPTLKTINHKPVGEVLGGAVERTDPDRHAAEWALRLGGTVWVDGVRTEIKDDAEVPKNRFTVTNVNVVYMPRVTDASLENLRGLSGLKYLNLGGTSVTDEGLIHFKDHKGLTHLVLERLKLTKTGMTHLKNLKGLQMLHLHSVPLTDDGLSELMGLKKLTTLDLSYSQLTEAGLARLKHFKALSMLALGGTAATDDTVEHLKDLELTSLFLTETKLTDIGLARLKHFKGLRTLGVEKTAVTPQGLSDFHAAVPGCRIHHDGGIFEAKE